MSSPKTTTAAEKRATPRRRTTTGTPRRRRRKPTHAQISERAYFISLAEGGDDLRNWLRAERELAA